MREWKHDEQGATMSEPQRLRLAHGQPLNDDNGNYIRADDPAYLLMRRKAAAFNAIADNRVTIECVFADERWRAWKFGKMLGPSFSKGNDLLDVIESALKAPQ